MDGLQWFCRQCQTRCVLKNSCLEMFGHIWTILVFALSQHRGDICKGSAVCA